MSAPLSEQLSEQPSDPFTGARVRLRAIKEEDFAAFHRWWSDPELLTHQTTGPLTLRTQDANEEMFRGWLKDSQSSVNLSVERREDEILIGQCSLWGISPSGHWATLGIVFGRDYWNEGYGTEALSLVLNYAFHELNLNRVQLTVNADNARAIRAYKKAGFQEEGRAREAFFRDGQWRDMLYMGVLRKDFQPAWSLLPDTCS